MLLGLDGAGGGDGEDDVYALAVAAEEDERAREGEGEAALGGAGAGASMDVLLEEAALASREEAEDGAWGRDCAGGLQTSRPLSILPPYCYL